MCVARDQLNISLNFINYYKFIQISYGETAPFLIYFIVLNESFSPNNCNWVQEIRKISLA